MCVDDLGILGRDIRGFKGLVDPEGVRSGSVWVRLLKGLLTHTYTDAHVHTGRSFLIACGQVPIYLTCACV